MKHKLVIPSLAAAFTPLATFAAAHPGHVHHEATHSAFASGFLHPMTGLDHLLAMIAVGLWAAQMGGRRMLWILPSAFLLLMAVGGALGFAGVALPAVESGIVASVVVLGLLIAFAARLPMAAAISIVAAFALFHGNAHGLELAAGSSAVGYTIGFLIATALLHAAGLLLGFGAKKLASGIDKQQLVFRLSGAAVAICGVVLTVNLF